MKYPFVSVVLSTYNRAEYLKKSVESVLRQTYTNFEFIIVDDGSSDNTKDILSFYAMKDPKITVIRNAQNQGQVVCLNEGILQSRGIYIARIDDDDFWCDPAKLEKQVEFLEKHREAIMVGGGQIRVNVQGKVLARYLPPASDRGVRTRMLRTNPFPHPSVMFRKEVWEKAGRYDETLNFSEDWDLWMRFGRLGTYANISEYVVTCLKGSQNRSNYTVKANTLLNLKLRFRYRKEFPGFVYGYCRGIIAFCVALIMQKDGAIWIR
jgi:glycosyltransferase involved in cell wall biosynthesis